jgi:hypothetical protein
MIIMEDGNLYSSKVFKEQNLETFQDSTWIRILTAIEASLEP